jgi:hypothetical protein
MATLGQPWKPCPTQSHVFGTLIKNSADFGTFRKGLIAASAHRPHDRIATDPVRQSYVATFTLGTAPVGMDRRPNLRVDVRWSASDAELARTYAAQLIGLIPSVIMALRGVLRPGLAGPHRQLEAAGRQSRRFQSVRILDCRRPGTGFRAAQMRGRIILPLSTSSSKSRTRRAAVNSRSPPS